MIDVGPQPSESNKAEAAILARQAESVSFDACRSIARLLVGMAQKGGDDLIARLREWETAHPPEPTCTSAEVEAVRPLADSLPFRSLRAAVQAMTSRTAGSLHEPH